MISFESLWSLGFPAHLEGLALLGMLAAFGLLVGILTGLFGVGGGFMITPVLSVAFGIPYPIVIGSSLSFTIGTASSGASRHLRMRNFEPRCVLVMGIAAVIFALLGGHLNHSLKHALGDRGFEILMDALFVGMLTLTALMVLRDNPERREGKSFLQRISLPPYINLPTAELDRVSLMGLFLVGATIGLMKGMLGIGGGVLFMPLLILVVGLSAHQAVGTSLGVVVFSSIAGTIEYARKGNVNLWIVLALLISSVFGVQIGAYICHKLHADRLQKYFAVLVALVAVMVAVRLVWTLSHPEASTPSPG